MGVLELANNDYKDKVVVKRRMLIIFSIFFVLFFALLSRLAYLMIYKSSEYTKIATEQWTSEVKIDAKRGRILDRYGNELAVSANVYRIDIDMNTLRSFIKSKKMTMEEIGDKLSDALGMDKKAVSDKLNAKLSNGLSVGSVILKRRIEKTDADKVKALKFNGVIISPDTKRYYPQNNFLAQVIGHTNSDGVGLTGIELMYNKELCGTPGNKIAEIDKQTSNELPYTISDYTKPVDGKDIVLTIDEMIQYFCEKAANEAMTNNKANAVSIMVMDPKNGEVLAMVNKPDYDLNNPWVSGKSYDELQKLWRNRCVSDTFEPGSIFKVVTATAAMEEKVVSDSDRFYCNGSLTVGKNVIHCANRNGHGDQNFLQIIENSCNVGFMTLGQRLGAEKLLKYVDLFGFSKKTGIDLNGEGTGIVKRKNVSAVDLATMSFGQVNTVTPIQYMAGFNAIANGGKWIRPHVMKEILPAGGSVSKPEKLYNNLGEKTILDSATMKTLRGYLEKVVSEGGGKNAFIEGYHIAGKTGTAQKPINGRYATDKYIASFAGMAPASDPKITVFVSIDEPDPSNYYASQISAPVAKQVFNDVFNYLAIKPDASNEDVIKSLQKKAVVPNVRGLKKDEAIKVLKDAHFNYDVDNNGDTIINMTPLPGFTTTEGSKIILYSGSAGNYNKKVVVPDLQGYTLEKVAAILNNLGLKFTTNGEGIVSEQSIKAGTEVDSGSSIELSLDKIGD